jgi:hypothetical protein
LPSQSAKEKSFVSRLLFRLGMAWCGLVITIGAIVSLTELVKSQPRATIEGALTLSAIALFPGFFCFVLSWVFSPPREDGAGNGHAGP